MSVQVRSFLNARRNRAVGTIMGALDGRLRAEHRDEVRRAVQEAVNSYHDCVLDLLRSEQDVIRNDEVVALLERVEAQLSTARRPGSNEAADRVDDRPRGGARCPS